MKHRSFRYRDKGAAYAMLAPALLLLCVFVAVPLVMALVRSVQDYATSGFVGLKNYLYVLQTPSFLKSFGNVLLMTFFTVLLTMLFAFLFALLMRSLNNRLGYLARAAVFLPFFIRQRWSQRFSASSI